ncbi:UNVERIFIED_CONTAM: SWI/SNF complex subunit SWI3C [Sesamum calycinum]|uniref:SWI/SNF complex subunit SWI3C n=1 Tax=Sesamum calycinum TaxID=2727403 RepID=A0AAW2QN77_9LAMI
MPASSSEARARWRKRKRDQSAARKSKLKEHENDDVFEDNEDDDDPDLDPPQTHLEAEDGHPNHSMDRTNHIMGEKESEKLVGGGVKICEFPIAIKREVTRPHSSVFQIVEAERAARNGDSRGEGQGGVAVLENISYGQLQALSAVPRDSPALLGVPTEETASGSGGGSYVITPPRIIAGHGVTKRLGSAGRVHVVPVHSDWFSPNSVHRLERQVVPHFFSGKSAEHTPEKYMECRNFFVAKSLGIINYCATPLKHEPQKDGTYLCEDSNSELHVPSAALKSIDSLIKFDKPKCRLKAADVYPELACQSDQDSDFDSTIREQLSEHRCNCCSRSIPTVYYQSQKESMLAQNQKQCILHFVRLPLDGVPLDKIDVPSTSGSMDLWSHENHERSEPNSNGLTLQGDDSESKFPFLNSGNPVMHLVAFLASALGPRVAAACAHASLASLSKDSDKEGSPSAEMANSSRKGPWSQHDAEGVPLSAEKVNAAAKDGLVAAAMKAKLFADHEEREIQRLSANIINHQLKRLELKLKQFAEVETLLMRECEQMERARQRIASERALMMSAQFGSAGVSRPMGLPGVGNAIVNNTSGNSRQQVSGSPQTFVSGYGNNQPVHPHMSLMQQQGMYGLGPRLPLSAIHPSSSASNTMFSPTSNSSLLLVIRCSDPYLGLNLV